MCQKRKVVVKAVSCGLFLLLSGCGVHLVPDPITRKEFEDAVALLKRNDTALATGINQIAAKIGEKEKAKK